MLERRDLPVSGNSPGPSRNQPAVRGEVCVPVARPVPGAHRVHSRARSIPGAHRDHSRAHFVPGAHRAPPRGRAALAPPRGARCPSVLQCPLQDCALQYPSAPRGHAARAPRRVRAARAPPRARASRVSLRAHSSYIPAG